MNQCAVVFFAGLVAIACGGSSPATSAGAAPSPMASGGAQPAVSSVSGFVLDTGFRPVPGASVVVVDSPQANAATTADATGRFSLTGTFDGTTRFRATKAGYVTVTQAFQSTYCSNGTGSCAALVEFYLASSTAPPLNIAGDYTLTFIADNTCADIPNELRTRTYAAKITSTSIPNMPADASFTATAGGASFLGSFNSFPIGVSDDYLGLSLHGGHDPPIVEQLAPNTYLAFSGNGAASVGRSSVSTVSMAFDGWIDYCVMPAPMGAVYNCGTSNTTGEPIPGLAVTRVHCESPAHRLILTRR